MSAVAAVAVAAVLFVVVVLTDASPPHPRRWSTSCQARGGDVAPATAARSSPGDSGGVGATPMSVVELTTQAGMRRLCRVLHVFLVDALAPTLLV